jgi:hypothetical protein
MQAIHDALLHVHILQLLIDRQGKSRGTLN